MVKIGLSDMELWKGRGKHDESCLIKVAFLCLMNTITILFGKKSGVHPPDERYKYLF